ncbi:MAG TPA: hypothetical protein PLH23_08230 [Hyphomonadaceae bacterium]|nr:hypothetical protein [Hyphomonadaceae bacterium]
MQEVPPPLLGAPTNEDLGIPIWLEPLLWVTVVIVAIWLASSIFIHLRRRATNLTSTHQAKVDKSATPDFMSVDHKAREAAIKRGEVFDKELTEREKAEAAAAAGKPVKKGNATLLQSVAGMASFLFSLFSLAGVIVNVFTQMDRMNSQIGKSDQIFAAVMKYPIPTVICVFVLVYTLWYWISNKKWLEPPKI